MHHSNEKMLKASDLANIFGVDRSTIYRWLEKGILPDPYELGDAALRWRWKDIEDWLEQRRRNNAEPGEDTEQDEKGLHQDAASLRAGSHDEGAET